MVEGIFVMLFIVFALLGGSLGEGLECIRPIECMHFGMQYERLPHIMYGFLHVK